MVAAGGQVNFAITPDSGYMISDVFVDGVSVGSVAAYQFTNVVKGHTITANFAKNGATPSLLMLNHRVTDAEYSKQLDRIITVSRSPENKLYIVNPSTGANVSIDLPAIPATVSISPDGLYAAVGHNGWVSYVDLNSQVLLKTYPVSTNVSDVVLAGNGYAYTFSDFHSLNLQTGAETQSENYIFTIGWAKLHPSGKAIYGADIGFSPSDIFKYDITKGTATELYDSPYHGDYPMCENLWMSEDGFRIFTTCGNAFRSSENKSEDMIYNGSLADIKLIIHLSHSTAANMVAAIPQNTNLPPAAEKRDNKIWIYDYQFLSLKWKYALPSFSLNSKTYTGHGKFVFFSSDGARLYAILQADGSSGMLLDYAIAVFDTSQAGQIVHTITSSSGTGGTVTPAGATVLLDGETASFTVTPNIGYTISDVLVNGVSVGSVSSYQFTNVVQDHSIKASFAKIETIAITNISEYFPLSPGAKWTYSIKGTSKIQTVSVESEKFTVEGTETSVIKEAGSNNLAYYTSDEEGIRLHGYYYPKYNAGGKKVKARLTFIPPLIMAKNNATGGQKIQSNGTVKVAVSGYGAKQLYYSSDYALVGAEKISVPAGTYDTLKISGSLTVNGQAETDTVWLAKGIGEVKEAYKESGEETTVELISSNVNSSNEDVYDLAVTKIIAPKEVVLKAKSPNKTVTVAVTIQNRGPHVEVINEPGLLNDLVNLKVNSLGTCADPVPTFISTSPKKTFPLSMKTGDFLTINYRVAFTCANDPARTTIKSGNHNDYSYTASVNHAILDGNADSHPADDVCPRTVTAPYEIDPVSNGTIKDRGCGAQLKDKTFGGDILTDIIVK